MRATRIAAAALALGVACALLQPEQPQSMIAAALLTVAVLLATWEVS